MTTTKTKTKKKENKEKQAPDADYQWYTTPHGDFRVEKHRFGTYMSVGKDGTNLVTGLTEEAVVLVTGEHLRWAVEGYDGPTNTYSGEVGGKL